MGRSPGDRGIRPARRATPRRRRSVGVGPGPDDRDVEREVDREARRRAAGRPRPRRAGPPRRPRRPGARACGRRPRRAGRTPGAGARSTGPAPPSRHSRLRRSASQHSAHSAPVPWTTKLRVNRPQARRWRSRSSPRLPPRRAARPGSTGRSAHAPVGTGEPRPSRVCTTSPRSPARAASSTSPIARG